MAPVCILLSSASQPPTPTLIETKDTGGAPQAELPTSGAGALHACGDLEAVPPPDGPPGASRAIHASGPTGRDRPLP